MRVSESRRATRTMRGFVDEPLDGWTRSSVYAFAVIGNNLPDLDFTYAGISGKTFGYLLQHRGYSHTLPAALGFAAAMLGVLLLLARWRKKTLPRADWPMLAAVALVSPLLHIAMDFANNYGVHPFWPVYDGWFYGDSFFILEPSFWLVLIAPLSFSYRFRPLRVVLWLILGVALVALWYRALVPRSHALVLSALTLSLLSLARRRSARTRMLMAASGFVVLGAAFVLGSRLAKAEVRAQAQLLYPSATVLDIVVTPMPANPFCWSALLVSQDDGKYSVRLGRAATWPAWLNLRECPFDRDATPTAPLQPLASSADARVLLLSEYRVAVADLRSIADARCEARAFFRFARVPYLTAIEPDGSRVLGDLRYDRKRGLDFSDIRLTPEPGSCPRYVPPWRPPRADIVSVDGQAPRLSIPETRD